MRIEPAPIPRTNCQDRSMKIAVVTDSMSAYGGAERVIEQILKLYPTSDIFTVLDVVPEGQRGFLGGRKIHSSSLQKLPFVAKYYRKLLHMWPLAVEQLDILDYDLVISTHHSVAYGILTRPGQTHVSYVFSPARYAWDLQHQYLRESGLDRGVLGMIARRTLHRMRLWDYAAAQRPDAMAACSEFVSDRMWRVHRRRAEVIYPPVPPVERPQGVARGDYYLSVGRMVPYKRIDLLAQAFSQMPDRKLKIVGTGPDMKKIAAACGPNVEMLGFCSNDEVRNLMAGARAFMFAGIEDFGITPVEAQALGTPVIAYADGGLRETVIGAPAPNPTGVFFHEQSTTAIIGAVAQFENEIDQFTPEACIANADFFSEAAFRDSFRGFVDRALAAQRNPAVSGRRATDRLSNGTSPQGAQAQAPRAGVLAFRRP
jgi:glycosyltransferase involved in cell wall biosynthesis